MGMTIIPKVKEERILNGTAVIHRVHWLFPEETEDRLRSAAQALFPDDPAGYPVRVSLLDTESQAYRLRILPEGTDCFDASRMHSWFARYQAGWLRENKPSELWRLRQFLRDTERKCRVAHNG